MARSRNIKPGFFKNEDLGAVPREARLLFIGLWTLADREGRLEDRPARITAEVFPYDRDITIGKVDEWLQSLNDCPERFIVRYSSGKTKYLQISNFVKHQSPHVKEQASTIPAPDMPGASPVQAPDMPDLGSDMHQPRQCVAPPDSLNPSSLNPESVEEHSSPAIAVKPSKASHGTRFNLVELPNDWREWVCSDRPQGLGWSSDRAMEEFTQFSDYWNSVAGAKGRKADWLATWRNRCREVDQRSGQRGLGFNRSAPEKSNPIYKPWKDPYAHLRNPDDK